MPTSPTVSFVVPCYRLAHFLPDCLRSILGQTFRDLEVLVMDDCSPDDVAGALRDIADARVQHIRHPRNIGHLRNYNSGIERSRGEFVWLISADDRLRGPDTLARFVGAMRRWPDARFAFSPVVLLENGVETTTMGWSAGRDTRLDGHEFLRELLETNGVPAASAMSRLDGYRRVGGFPLDLPHAGDWFMWCAFALEGAVVSLAEPLVNYRMHDANMSLMFLTRPDARTHDEVALRWRILRKAEARGFQDVVSAASAALVSDYAARVTGERERDGRPILTLDGVERSLREYCRDDQERTSMRRAIDATLERTMRLQLPSRGDD